MLKKLLIKDNWVILYLIIASFCLYHSVDAYQLEEYGYAIGNAVTCSMNITALFYHSLIRSNQRLVSRMITDREYDCLFMGEMVQTITEQKALIKKLKDIN